MNQLRHQLGTNQAASLVQRLELLSLHSFTFRAAISSQFGLQSHVFSLAFRAILVQVFRATISFQFGIQSQCPFTVQHSELYSWRSETSFIVWSSEPLCILIQAFRVTIFPPFDIQSHFSQPYHSESQLLAFIFIGIAHLIFMILHLSSFSSPHYLVLISCSSCSSRLPLPLHMTVL